MIRWICERIAQSFPPLPPLPWRPLLGVGATVGPVRPIVVCIAVLCAPSTTAPPNVSELIPRAEPPPTSKQSLQVAPPAPWRGIEADHRAPVPIPVPSALALFGGALALLVCVRPR